ncbi:hypothetical protein LEP1GSC133_0526 [Leptospira borgpetersenii serovar Pomona str. 200901868]|uniref:Uncharacterized protein n=1 Tax=Leptospira borgpetersenii serovar Pomona str. 200901868 TaxID=1192866 RepID=M6WIR6_LEPBO|nr:hypothetical protein LEP1GSC133_0526 [Leptospira borgpetersenii serovar Pomona str. 200901868]
MPLLQKTVLGKLLVPSVGFLVLRLMLASNSRFSNPEEAPFCLNF